MMFKATMFLLTLTTTPDTNEHGDAARVPIAEVDPAEYPPRNWSCGCAAKCQRTGRYVSSAASASIIGTAFEMCQNNLILQCFEEDGIDPYSFTGVPANNPCTEV